MRIVWLSANRFGWEMLRAARQLRGDHIKAIITLHPKAATKMYDDISIKDWFGNGVPTFMVERLNHQTSLLRGLKPDYVIMAGWRQIISPEILKIPKYGFIGFHPTRLPKGRGPAPIINSILSGDPQGGVTMYHVTEGLDDGDIIAQEPFQILCTDHASDVYRKMTDAGIRMLKQHWQGLMDGTSPRQPQDHSKATTFSKPNGQRIDPVNDSIEDALTKIRAFSRPYNGAYIELEGRKLIIWEAGVSE